MKIAVMSDIHGNSWALEAVLTDIKEKGIEHIYDLGDSLYGPLDPIGAFNLIRDNGIVSLRGNQDRFILENIEVKQKHHTLEYVLNELNDEALSWLMGLPSQRIIENKLFAFHGTPANDTEYLLEKLNKEFVGVKESNDILKLISGIKENIVLCGHSHTPRIVEISNKLIVNPGSVGLQAYDDELPLPHKMENFNPRARYSVINLEEELQVEQIAIPYNFEQAAIKAEENNRPDWAKWLRAGVA